MGTHPIFESDFDCLTEYVPFGRATPGPDPVQLSLSCLNSVECTKTCLASFNQTLNLKMSTLIIELLSSGMGWEMSQEII